MAAIGKERCPQCAKDGNDTSGDNLVIFDDEGKRCFACGYTILSKDELIRRGGYEIVGKPFDESVRATIGGYSLDPNGFRGLTRETCAKYRVRHKYDDNGEVIEQYYPATKGYELSGYKVRKNPKDFDAYGTTGKVCEMFGQFIFRNTNSKTVIVTGGECFKSDTEVLTSNGFIQFGSLTGNELVAQVSGDSIEYVEPLNFIRKEYCGEMVKLVNKRFVIDCTENHNLAYYDKNDNLIKAPANERISATRYFKGYGYHYGEGTGLSYNQIALIIAVAADSKFDVRKSGKIVFHFSLLKQRKIERLKSILESLCIPFTSYTKTHSSTGKTYTSFNFDKPEFMSGKGIPTEWITSTSVNEKNFIIDEMVEWDGNRVKDRNHFEFSSKSLSEASIMQVIAVTCGYTATIRKRKNSLGEWYSVTIIMKKDGKYSSQAVEKNKEFYNYSGMVYCVTVPSGVIITRQSGRVVRVGNCDAMSAFQMMSEYQKSKGNDVYESVPVVSCTVGEQSTASQIQTQYEWFNKFEKIILCLDNDDAGQKAMEECMLVLPKGKTYKLEMSLKDPNEYLKAGRVREFVSAYFSAKPIVPAGIIGSGELYDKMVGVAKCEKIPLPPFMKKLSDMLGGGISLGHIINFASASGSGKTSVVNELLYYWMYNCDYKLGVVSMELNAGQYGLAMLSRHMGIKINKMSANEQMEFLNRERTKLAISDLLTRDGVDRWMLVDDRDGSVEDMKAMVESLIIGCGCNVIILDPMSDIIEGLSNEDQSLFIKWQKGMIKSHNVTFINVCHTRKTGIGEKAGSEGAILTEESIFGTSSIFKSSSANILFSRNKYAEDDIERNTINVRLSKNRAVGETGEAGKWFYDFKTSTMYDYDDWLSGVNAISGSVVDSEIMEDIFNADGVEFEVADS